MDQFSVPKIDFRDCRPLISPYYFIARWYQNTDFSPQNGYMVALRRFPRINTC